MRYQQQPLPFWCGLLHGPSELLEQGLKVQSKQCCYKPVSMVLRKPSDALKPSQAYLVGAKAHNTPHPASCGQARVTLADQ